MLPISEVFGPTIQGEGKYVGRNSVFIRFGGCNLRCKGFGCEYTTPDGKERVGCDSWYAVDPAFKKEWNLVETYDQIVSMIDELHIKSNSKPDIVITGGEPTLYWKDDEFQKLLAYYITRGYRVTIETNASIDIQFSEEYQKRVIFSMSVKMAVSGEPYEKRINVDNIENILRNSPESYFKFVIEGNDDVEEILELLKQIPSYADVYLMPLGETKKELDITRKKVAETAIELGFNYSPRAHIDIWDDMRAV